MKVHVDEIIHLEYPRFQYACQDTVPAFKNINPCLDDKLSTPTEGSKMI
jgi:hypothetical protein